MPSPPRPRCTATAEYFYVEGTFYQAASGGGYVVVEPPVGAIVLTILAEAIREEEGDLVVHQFDEVYFTEDRNDADKKIYRVEPQPPEEEIDEIPAGSSSFVADGALATDDRPQERQLPPMTRAR